MDLDLNNLKKFHFQVKNKEHKYYLNNLNNFYNDNHLSKIDLLSFVLYNIIHYKINLYYNQYDFHIDHHMFYQSKFLEDKIQYNYFFL